MTLRVNGATPTNIFGTFGSKENTATYALGWVLEQSSHLRRELLSALGLPHSTSDELHIELQKHGEDGGFTDVELRCPGRYHLIIEAKRGWVLPHVEQLLRYAPRLHVSGSEDRALVSVSAANRQYARRLPEEVQGIRVCHLPWSELQAIARRAQEKCKALRERVWLNELDMHLEAYVSIQNPSDNNVYVVSVGSSPIKDGSGHTWIDVVEKQGVYFHPLGISGWPAVPPNYIGFRYRGKLQSVHHIASFEVVQDLSVIDRHWPSTSEDHFLYRLGPPMRPHVEVATGNVWPTGRLWCAIDTLLSGEFATISVANRETKRRLGKQEEESTAVEKLSGD